MTNSIGPLVPADELFCHQVTDTFACVGPSDYSWTEKVCAMAAARDGSLQVGFGLGKYTNRDVMDAYGGISRGKEQITVRASRRLGPEPEIEQLAIGPVRYEVLEPMKRVRFTLDDNDCQPIAFDFEFVCTVPPFLEERTYHRDRFRVSADLVRYHQTGIVGSGWVSIDGQRTQLSPETWVSTRDHSWGVRYDVGQRPVDIEPAAQRNLHGDVMFEMIWCPVSMERPDGSKYALFMHYQVFEGPGIQTNVAMGGVEHPDGTMERWQSLRPELTFDPVNRRLRGGVIHATMADGSSRDLRIEVVSDTGFHLGAGLYFGFDGHHHGEFRGPLHVDGERIPDCTTPEQAGRLHQIRDTVIHVVDPVGGGEGWGNCQPIHTGGPDSFM